MDFEIVLAIAPGEEEQVIDLVRETFDAFVAPGCSSEGVAAFRQIADARALADRVANGRLVWLAKREGAIVGVIEARPDGHVSLLFVSERHQRARLTQSVLEACRRASPDLREATVNSAPNAVAAYQAMGFEPTDAEKCENGIRFVPMRMKLADAG